jgi:hypothetical protein
VGIQEKEALRGLVGWLFMTPEFEGIDTHKYI